MTVMDFEEYSASRGVSRTDLCNAGLHARGHMSDTAHRRAMQRMADDAREWEIKREALREDYDRKVAAGELRPKTHTERLIATARGHEDLPATHAARRILERRGVAFFHSN